MLSFRHLAAASGLAIAIAGPGAYAEVVNSSLTLNAGYALAFGGLNHLDTGFPVTRDACRFQGNACAVSTAFTMPVAQFDPSLGTLESISITFTSRASFSGRIQSRHTFGTGNRSGTWTIDPNMRLLSTISLAGTIANDPIVPQFGAFGFPNDPIAFSGFDFVLHGVGALGSASIVDTLSPSDTTNLINSSFIGASVSSSFTDQSILDAFTGAGSMSFLVAQHSDGRASSTSNSAYTISQTNISGPAGSVPFINTLIHNFSPTISIDYTYSVVSTDPDPDPDPDPSSQVPAPGGVLLFALGLLSVGALRRRQA